MDEFFNLNKEDQDLARIAKQLHKDLEWHGWIKTRHRINNHILFIHYEKDNLAVNVEIGGKEEISNE